MTQKMMQEQNLTNLAPEIDLSQPERIGCEKSTVLRAAACEVSGHFAARRVQIIGYMEYTYLMQLRMTSALNIDSYFQLKCRMLFSVP